MSQIWIRRKKGCCPGTVGKDLCIVKHSRKVDRSYKDDQQQRQNDGKLDDGSGFTSLEKTIPATPNDSTHSGAHIKPTLLQDLTFRTKIATEESPSLKQFRTIPFLFSKSLHLGVGIDESHRKERWGHLPKSRK